MILKTPGCQMGSPAAAEEGGEARGGREWREKVSAKSTLESTAPIVISRSREARRGYEQSTEDFSESVIEITVVGIVIFIIVGHRSARANISLPVCNNDILECKTMKFNERHGGWCEILLRHVYLASSVSV